MDGILLVENACSDLPIKKKRRRERRGGRKKEKTRKEEKSELAGQND